MRKKFTVVSPRCRLAALSLAGSVAALLLSGCALFPREQQPMPPPLISTPQITYNEVKVAKTSIIDSVTGSGRLISVYEKGFSFQYTGGTLESIRVKEGDTVKAGDVLATLYTDKIDDQIAQQKLTVEQAKINLEKVKSEANGKDTFDVKTAQLELERAQLTLSQYEKQKEESTLRSTMNGIVTWVTQVDPGSSVGAFQTLVTIADPTQLQIRYRDNNVADFVVGAKVTIKYKSGEYQGTVVQNTAESGTSGDNSNAYAQIKFDKLPQDAALGDTVIVTLVRKQKDNVIVLPSSYVHNLNGKYYVYQLDANGLRVQKSVEIGISTSTEVEITKGLEEGETVIQ